MAALIASITSVLRAAVYRSGQYIFYRYDPIQQREGCLDPMVREYANHRVIPSNVRKRALRHFLLNPMYYRLRSRQATLLCIYDSEDIVGYGWVQSWHPFRRRLGWMYASATVLGPYWTDPRHRGKGVYGRLLGHSLAVCNRQSPIVIYVECDNVPSRKGIEKAGFSLVGAYELRRILWFIERHRKLPVPGGEDNAA